jgi:outer membrane protein, heavy metal efflux system
MSSRRAKVCALAVALVSAMPPFAQAEPSGPSGVLTLSRALQRALAANPKLAAADRDIGIAAGKRIQAGAIPNPELSFELENAFGTGQ